MFTMELFPAPASPKTMTLCLGPQCSVTRPQIFAADLLYFSSYKFFRPFQLVIYACPTNVIFIVLIVSLFSCHHYSMSSISSNPVTTTRVGAFLLCEFFQT